MFANPEQQGKGEEDGRRTLPALERHEERDGEVRDLHPVELRLLALLVASLHRVTGRPPVLHTITTPGA